MTRRDRHSRSPDTHPRAHTVQLGIYRRLTPEERTAMAEEMSEDARRVTLEGIRRRNPDWGEKRCLRELFRRIHGAELFARVWGGLGRNG